MTDLMEDYFREYAQVRDDAHSGKVVCLTEKQNEMLQYIFRKHYECGCKTVPRRYSMEYLSRFFKCGKEDVRSVFEFPERRCLIARRPAPRRGWEWLRGAAREEAVLGQPLAAFGY